MKGPDPCWEGYEMIGKKEKNSKEVPNCVPKKASINKYIGPNGEIYDASQSENIENKILNNYKKSHVDYDFIYNNFIQIKSNNVHIPENITAKQVLSLSKYASSNKMCAKCGQPTDKHAPGCRSGTQMNRYNKDGTPGVNSGIEVAKTDRAFNLGDPSKSKNL
jgi:hypothetical protein